MPTASIGVIVPCHNEAAIVWRKLANLARMDWPETSGQHRVVIVDDGSTDGTGQLARAACEELFGEEVRADVVTNTQRPGKPGAITSGLFELGLSVDLVCLSDCDVLFDPAALVQLAEAFERDPELVMATGEQCLVGSLASDGSLTDAEGAPLQHAGEKYDDLTSFVRRFESRRGMVFSVHGQLLAWRARLALRPTPGIAADDLDLMLQARSMSEGRGRIVQVTQAIFYEELAPAGHGRRQQVLRRARAYVQFLRHPRIGELTRSGDLARRVQGLFYRTVPAAAPWAALVIVTGLWFAISRASGFEIAQDVMLGLGIVFVAIVLGPKAFGRLLVIARAQLIQLGEDMGDRWETARK